MIEKSPDRSSIVQSTMLVFGLSYRGRGRGHGSDKRKQAKAGAWQNGTGPPTVRVALLLVSRLTIAGLRDGDDKAMGSFASAPGRKLGQRDGLGQSPIRWVDACGKLSADDGFVAATVQKLSGERSIAAHRAFDRSAQNKKRTR